MPRIFRQFLSDESGAELVEFALGVCVWVACIFAIMYGSFALYAAHFVGNAAAEGARYAIVRGSTWSGTACSTTSTLECDAASTDVSNYIVSTLPPGMSPANLTVTASWPGTTSAGATCDTESGANSPNCLVKVQVSYSFSFPVPFLTENTIPMSSYSEMTISQ
ncbi:MAG TPA: TadE/TadG family type IV pilus assembly protein [Terracidiphilus sp.]|jgi:Flp pilus assembly protein TadG|nr:TadE/TadG family type IV pilus assembly protein [Terracidiphilus sp.]